MICCNDKGALMNKLIRINIDNERFNLNMVNCLEIGIYYYLGLFGTNFQQYFLLFLKLIQSYNIPQFSDTDIIYPVNIHKYIQLILNDKLKVKINYHDFLDNGFYDLIESLITEGKPVLITGNLKELYYSKNYKEKDTRHVFLINGFDKEKRLFKIINGEHYYVRNKCKYRQFVIPYQTIKKMLKSYRRAFGEFFICDFELSNNKFEEALALKECLSLFIINNTDAGKYREVIYVNDIIQKISKETDHSSNVDEFFLRTIKYKEMFYSIFASSISEIYGGDNLANTIISLKESMISLWEDICNTCLLGLYKNTMFDIESRLKEVMSYEMEMEGKLKDLNKYDGGTFYG